MVHMDEKADVQFKLPFKPYPNQLVFMKDAYECFDNSRFGLFESPTGSGKTISILCSSLTWLKNNEVKSLMCNLNFDSSDDQNIPEWVRQTAYSQKLHMAENIIREREANLENLRKKISERIDNTDGLPRLRSGYKRTTPNPTESDPQEEVKNPNKVQIIVCSRTFSQLNQYVKEFRKLNDLNKNVRLAVGCGRTHVCINDGVRNRCGNSDELNEECRRSKCEYRSNTAELSEISTCYALDLEDLVRFGKELNSCAYYSNLNTVPSSDVILAPYVTIINESLRESLGIRIRDNIIIFDEGHNLIDALTESHSCKLSLIGLKDLLNQLRGYFNKYKSEIKGVVLERVTEMIKLVVALTDGMSKVVESENMRITTFNVKYALEDFKFHEIINFLSSTQFCRHLRGYAERQYHIKAKLESSKMNESNNIIVGVNNNNSKCIGNNIINSGDKGGGNGRNVGVNMNDGDSVRNSTRIGNGLLNGEMEGKRACYTSMIYSLKNFIYSLLYCDTNDQIIISKEESDTVIEIFPVASEEFFHKIVTDARSVIVMSGTLSPIEEFLSLVPPKSEPLIHKSPPVFSNDRFLTTILDRDSKGEELVFDYSRRENRRELEYLCELMENLAENVPNGIVCFFSSYSYLNVFYNFFIKSGSFEKVSSKKDIFKDQSRFSIANMPISAIDMAAANKFLENFNVFPEYSKKCLENGAILFAVFGGSQSEGVDFSDELARLVLLVGIPYPQDNVKLKLKRDYYSKKALECSNESGRANYLKLSSEQRTLLCYKTINQCIGRAMRHKGDYAAVVLLDARYRRSEASRYLTNYVKKSISEHERTNKNLSELLQEFFKKLPAVR